MSVFDTQQHAAVSAPVGGSGDGKDSPDSDNPGSNHPGNPITPPVESVATVTPVTSQLDPHRDARELVRLVQCRQCSLLLRQPLTLTCGNSLCRACIPTLHKRENITYPADSGRSEGFQCPFEECGAEHSMADCSNDVTLWKLLDQVSAEVARYRTLTSDTPTLLNELPRPQYAGDSYTLLPEPRSRVLHGGRFVATFTMAELGELAFDADVSYQSNSPTGDTYQHLDYGMLTRLHEVTRNELDCHVCFALLLDPLTLACGHTFCRKCITRVLDHGQNCPACRRPLLLTPGTLERVQSNKRLSQLLLALCPEQVTARIQQAEADEAEMARNQQIPLFVCTLAYPRILTFLHIFEPRYRLMIRRAMEKDRRFGMLAYNGRAEAQGDLGATQFMQYGTLLEIVNIQMFPDGRSVIETIGVSRFRVRDHGMRDGYMVGRVDRIDDISIAEEEALEASAVGSLHPETTNPEEVTGLASSPESPDLEVLPTTDILAICTTFIRRMRAASAHWLSDHIIQAYGPMPDDPAIFPYWFASVLPINEAEKYRLLPTRSVRQRLMICAEWVRRVERTRWYGRLRELMESGTLADPALSSDGSSQPPAAAGTADAQPDTSPSTDTTTGATETSGEQSTPSASASVDAVTSMEESSASSGPTASTLPTQVPAPASESQPEPNPNPEAHTALTPSDDASPVLANPPAIISASISSSDETLPVPDTPESRSSDDVPVI